MAKPRNKFLDLLVYVALRTAVMFLRMLGLPTAYRLAGRLGDLLFRCSSRHRRRAIGHLRLSFPEWDEQRLARVARESMRSMCYMGLEVLLTPSLVRHDRWHRYISLSDYREVARLMIQRRAGLIALTGHFGNWEIAGYLSATIGFPGYAVARAIDNPYVNDYIVSVRERTGQRIIYKKGAAEQVQQVLGRGEMLSFVCDQDAGRKGLFVDFFARKASTFKSIALMAMQFQVPVALMCCRRIGATFRFEVWPQRIIEPAEWADRDDPLRWITQEYTRALEEAIRRYPEQYFWVHRRWKHRPKGEVEDPEGIS